jgi:hypothetical protein
MVQFERDIEAAMNEPSNAKPLTDLRNILVSRFSKEELSTLCTDLGVRYDDLPGDGKVARARELINLLNRRGRIKDLVETGQRSREDIDWPDTVSGGRTLPKPPVSASDSQPPQTTVGRHGFLNHYLHKRDMCLRQLES